MKKKVIIIPILIVAFAVLMSSFVVTKPGEYRVIKQFGRIVNVYENDGSSYGVNFKIPFIQSETVISSKMRLSDLPVSDVMTSDKKSMIADCFVMWKIDGLKTQLRNGHISRLRGGDCSIEAGFVWADLITNLERTSDHCSNVALCVIDATENNMNMHQSVQAMKKDSAYFEERISVYAQKYSI